MLNLCNAYRSRRKWRLMTSDWKCRRNKVAAKLCGKEREEGSGGGRWKKSPWRTAISFLSCFISPPPPPSPALLPPLAISHGLFPTSSRLGIWFPCAKARHYGEPPRRRARIKDSFGVIGRCYFLPSSHFSYFARNATPCLDRVIIELSPLYCRPPYEVIRVTGDAFFVPATSLKTDLEFEKSTL